jgi:hypothetical protein
VKQAIFHPEARAEMRESIEFYEARLDGLGLRFLSAVEQTAERISIHPEEAPPSPANSASGSFRVFPTTSSIASGRITSTSLPSLTTTVVRAIGTIDLPIVDHRLVSRLVLLSLGLRPLLRSPFGRKWDFIRPILIDQNDAVIRLNKPPLQRGRGVSHRDRSRCTVAAGDFYFLSKAVTSWGTNNS